MKNTALVAMTLAAALGAVPALAQPMNGNAPPTGPQAQQPPENRPAIGTATISPTGIPPSQRNPLLTDSGDVRIGKLVGTDVYNRNDKQVGSVDDVLASPNGQLQVVIATNQKKVLVPWDKVVFGDAKLNSDNKVLMPDATQAQLNKLPAFSYQNKNNR